MAGLYNVLMHAFAFMALFTAFQTSSAYQSTYLTNLNMDNVGFQSLAIVYVVFSFANFLATPIVEICGAKWSMFFSAFGYAAFIACFLKPMVWSILASSALLGLCAAVLWTAQGKFSAANSNASNRGVRAGLFWAILQSSLIVGNLLGVFVLPSKDEGIDELDSFFHKFYLILTCAACGGVLLMLLLRPTPKTNEAEMSITAETPLTNEEPTQRPSVITLFVSTFKLLVKKDMLLISLLIAYSGLELQMWSSNYPTIFGQYFDAKKIGFSGLCVGAGEIFGGLLFGRMADRLGKTSVVITAMVSHTTAFYLIYVNFLGVPWLNLTCALICSFLLGLGDSAINTAIYSMLQGHFASETTQAFALLKFFQSGTAGIAFFYAGYVALEYQLIINMVFLVAGTIGFISVERSAKFRSAYHEIKI